MTRPTVPDLDGLEAARDRVGPVAEGLRDLDHPASGVGVDQATGRRVERPRRGRRVHPRGLGYVTQGRGRAQRRILVPASVRRRCRSLGDGRALPSPPAPRWRRGRAGPRGRRRPGRSGSSGPPSARSATSTAPRALPTNSEPANSDTRLARADGSTSVAQVCSEECIEVQASPSSTAATTRRDRCAARAASTVQAAQGRHAAAARSARAGAVAAERPPTRPRPGEDRDAVDAGDRAGERGGWRRCSRRRRAAGSARRAARRPRRTRAAARSSATRDRSDLPQRRPHGAPAGGPRRGSGRRPQQAGEQHRRDPGEHERDPPGRTSASAPAPTEARRCRAPRPPSAG